jgi:hypothetical protein
VRFAEGDLARMSPLYGPSDRRHRWRVRVLAVSACGRFAEVEGGLINRQWVPVGKLLKVRRVG